MATLEFTNGSSENRARFLKIFNYKQMHFEKTKYNPNFERSRPQKRFGELFRIRKREKKKPTNRKIPSVIRFRLAHFKRPR